MNNKNIIRNSTNRLGMIAAVIAAVTMVVIAPIMIANADPGISHSRGKSSINKILYGDAFDSKAEIDNDQLMDSQNNDESYEIYTNMNDNKKPRLSIDHKNRDAGNGDPCGGNIELCKDPDDVIRYGNYCGKHDQETQTSHYCDDE